MPKDNLTGKYPTVTEPIPNLGNLFGSGYIDIGGYSYPVLISKPPTTPVIATPVTTSDGEWTEVIATLSGVYMWRASERTGQDFRYAYVAAPAAKFCTAFGMLQRNTALTAFYVQRPTTNNITIELEFFTQ